MTTIPERAMRRAAIRIARQEIDTAHMVGFWRGLAVGAMLTAALLMPGTSAAAPVFGLHAATWHERPGYESSTPGAYVVLDNGFTVGAYRNSVRRDSVYAGYTWSSGALAVTAGAVTGYPANPVQPLLVPSVRIGHVRLSLLPRPPRTRNSSGGVHLSYEF